MENIVYQENGYGGVIKITRPQALNALNSQILEELEEVLKSIEKNNLGCLVITGEGKRAFAAGADIGQMKNFSQKEAYEFAEKGKKVFQLLEDFSAPVVGAINGYALGGGCELALCCDIRICSDTAVFGQPEAGLGIIPGFGGTQRLARLVGAAKAKEMIYTGANIGAEEALRIGLVNAVYPLEDLERQSDLLAEKIAKNSSIAVKNCKKAINEGLERDLVNGMEKENCLFADCFEKKDQRERMQAFLEKKGRKE